MNSLSLKREDGFVSDTQRSETNVHTVNRGFSVDQKETFFFVLVQL